MLQLHKSRLYFKKLLITSLFTHKAPSISHKLTACTSRNSIENDPRFFRVTVFNFGYVSLSFAQTQDAPVGQGLVNGRAINSYAIITQIYFILIKMSKLYSISQAAQQLGVAVSTLRRWEYEGKLIPQRTQGNQRRYSAEQLMGMGRKLPPQSERVTLAYARVSSADQKQDLERQKTVLEMYCAAQGWTFELISDLGSGMNYRKKGLQSLLEKLLNGKIERLVITHKDRLLRFGAELIFSVCEMKGVEVVIINKGEEASFEEDLAKDVLEIITVFSARLYGSRSKKNQKLINGMKEAVKAAQ